ncbi:MAG: hypothetical protein ACLU9T_17605 [Blautia faecis]
MTSSSSERFFNEEDCVRPKRHHILNREKCKSRQQPDMPVLHPLLRVDEIVTGRGPGPKSRLVFDRVQNGKYIRMALTAGSAFENPVDPADRKGTVL